MGRKRPLPAYHPAERPDDAKLIAVDYRPARSEPISFVARGGVLTLELSTGARFEIEAYVRPGHPDGLYIRGLDDSISIEADASNTVRIMSRPVRS